MLIRDFALRVTGDARIMSATVAWEDRDFPDQVLFFEIRDTEGDAPYGADEPSADAFLAGCFPFAALHGEARVRIEGQPCPMLIDGLYTAHAWWTSWGGMPSPMPLIETPDRRSLTIPTGARRGVAFLSGGVDCLHMLMHNRRLYRQTDPAYIRDAVFIHGFDIGKRARDPENERFRTALRNLEPVAAELGLRLIRCRTNLSAIFHQSRSSGNTAMSEQPWRLLVMQPQLGRLSCSSVEPFRWPIRSRQDHMLRSTAYSPASELP